MRFQSAKTILSHPAIQARPDAVGLLTLEGDERTLTVLVRGCGEPDCDCRDLLITLEEHDADGTPISGGIRLSTWVDVDACRPVSDDELSPEQRILFGQALAAIPEELLREMSEIALQRKQSAIMLERATIPLDEIRGGVLQSWIDLSSGGKSLFQPGGNQIAGRLELDGREWLFDLLYCPDPACDCRAVHIYAQSPVREDASYDHAEFVVSATLDGSLQSVETVEGCARAQARVIAETWVASLADAHERFTEQYADVREVAVRNLERAPRRRSGRKIGRNDACPCGSGKKYKRCCLPRA